MLRQFIQLIQRRAGDVIRRGEQPDAKTGKGPGNQAFVLRLEKADQQIAVAVEYCAIFFLAFVGVAGYQIDSQRRRSVQQRRQQIAGQESVDADRRAERDHAVQAALIGAGHIEQIAMLVQQLRGAPQELFAELGQ